jgi:hypothetical protein
MKKIIWIGAAPVHGVIRYPSEGAFTVSASAPKDADDRVVTADEANALVDVGLAVEDDVDALKVAELRDLAAKEGADVGPAAKKAELVEAIRDNRSNEA